jgi:hypothetical protein
MQMVQFLIAQWSSDMNNFKPCLSKLLLLQVIMLCSVAIHAKAFLINPFFKSAIIPGWGQLSLGNSYGYTMLSGEILFWSGYLYNNNEQKLQNRASFDYALKYSHINPGNYSNQYFRDLSKFDSSGFSAGGYNAMVRQTAIELFQYDPVAQQAYIDENIYPDDMSWESYQLRKKYSGMRKDILELKDQAQIFTGLIIANHLISGIDMLRQRKHWNNVHTSIQYYNNTPVLFMNVEF